MYWLQGAFEVNEGLELSQKQVTVIRNHLNMVFKHEIDPSHGDEAHQKKLSEAHGGISTTSAQPIGMGTTTSPGSFGPGITSVFNC